MGCNGSSDVGVSVFSATREADAVQVSGVRRNVSGWSFNRQRHMVFRVRNQLNAHVGAGLKPAPTRFSSGTMAGSKTFFLLAVLVDLSENTK
jgi:hypothetical protein